MIHSGLGEMAYSGCRLISPFGALAMSALIAVTGLWIAPAYAATRISDDSGGRIDSLRKTGQQVVIDGTCASACTLVVGIIPRNRICVTSRAVLAFHAAWSPTQYLWSHYPEGVRHWITRHGGSRSQTIYLSGRDLAALLPACR
jgi:hypothetical protein